jgi:pimeloyl-ACP methyl ester carboxylesterase
MDELGKRPQEAKLLSLATDDGWDIDALLIEQGEVKQRPIEDRVALIYLHGKGHNMLSTVSRFLVPRLPQFTHFPLNSRSHSFGYMTGRSDAHEVAGGMYESNSVGHHDVTAAVRYLRDRGHRRVVLVGHSSGGWYAGEYGHHGEVDARILLSPLTDNRTAARWWFADESELASARAEAERLVDGGEPSRLINVNGWYYSISAASLLERLADTESRWLSGVNASQSPVLLLWGSLEDRFAVPWVRSHAIDGSDHYFVGFEDELAELVADFVTHCEWGRLT